MQMKTQNDSQDFDAMLVAKYPSLFPKDENGAPIQPSCGIYCPDGWKMLIDDLCGAICSHQRSYRFKLTKNKWGIFKQWLYQKQFLRIYNFLYKRVNPFCACAPKGFHAFSVQESKEIRDKYPRRLAFCKGMSHLSDRLRPNVFVKTFPPNIVVEQIKEKFGALRFYYSGGDDIVTGMVGLAECLSIKTCQETGERGSLCRKGSWYSTLSVDRAEKLGYTKL